MLKIGNVEFTSFPHSLSFEQIVDMDDDACFKETDTPCIRQARMGYRAALKELWNTLARIDWQRSVRLYDAQRNDSTRSLKGERYQKPGNAREC